MRNKFEKLFKKLKHKWQSMIEGVKHRRNKKLQKKTSIIATEVSQTKIKMTLYQILTMYQYFQLILDDMTYHSFFKMPSYLRYFVEESNGTAQDL